MTTAKPLPKIVQKNGGQRYMPLKLKKVLTVHGITQTEWASAIKQEGGRCAGRGLSSPMGTLMLNYNTWPKETSREAVVEQTEAFLRAHGVSEFEISTIWSELSAQDQGKKLQPKRDKQLKRPLSETALNLDIDLPEADMLSPAAKQHFKLFRDPFTDDVQSPDDVFLDSDQRYIREAMYQAAKHGGFLAVVGESGAGKTTLRRDLIDRIRRDGDEITVIQPRIIDKGRLTAGAICDAIIGDISQENPKRSLEAKARQIERLLTGSSRSGNAHALIIEEAHDLTVQTLKYLKRFWELEDGFRKLLAIILVGQPELKNHLDERQNWEAREVIRRCEIAELRPLDDKLEQYMELKFKRLGKALNELFEDDAYDALRARLTIRRGRSDTCISMLYPLVVNNAVTKALNLAANIGAPKVNAEIIAGV